MSELSSHRSVRGFVISGLLLGLIGACIGISGCKDRAVAPAVAEEPVELSTEEHAEAVFAGGCFWCVEAVFEELEGVHEAISGYSGGEKDTAQYEKVVTGTTGHAEAVEIVYDPSRISYEQLVHVHLATHDPTTLNRQGNDVGPQYRSAIFYVNEQEKKIAQKVIDELSASGAYDRKIVTALEPLKAFYPAEAKHQDYVCYNRGNPYVEHVAMPKVDKVRDKFKESLKSGSPIPGRFEPRGPKRPTDPPKTQPTSGNDTTESDKMTDKNEKVVRSEAEWRKLLTAEQYRVLREAGTERPFVNEFDEHFEPGTYSCAACGQELFTSETKFNSGCGWPAFYAAKAGDRVKQTADRSHGMVRTEVTCARCDSHLGHIFDDAPQTPTGRRYCINSVSLKFTPAAESGE